MESELIAVSVIAFVGGALAALFILRTPTRSAKVALPARDSEPVVDEYGSVVDRLDVGVARLGNDFVVRSMNPAAGRILGASDSTPRQRSLMETFVDHRVQDAAQDAAKNGSATIEITYGSDERRLALRFRRAPSYGLWMIVEDVTELRRLQRIRSEFIDNLSHELRTPLTTIRLLTETLTQDVDRPDANVAPRIRERINKIDVETTHLVQMVNELLDLSRIEGGAAELHFDDVRVGDVVSGAIERLLTFADRQRVSLVMEDPEDFAPVVSGDEERLGQVLVNLLHNAVKFSPPDSTVTIKVEPRDDQVAISVRDQGSGIPRKDLDRIFERFYKVDKARERGKGGTGLGLAIARHIVEGHGGRIWVESRDGRGATFTFTVPVTRS